MFSYDKQGNLIYENTFIYNLKGKSSEKTQIRPLKTLTNKFVIKEIEEERSYIDSLKLIAELSNGTKVVLNVINNDKLLNIDKNYLITNQGDTLEIEFESLPEKTIKTYIQATGYYNLIE